jgi:hypothetical protein
MSRLTVAVDRIVVVLLALALLAAGAAAAAWQTGRLLPSGMTGGEPLALPWARDVGDRAWWPWAVGALGVVLIALGVRWLVAHLPRRPGRTALAGSEPTGRLSLDLQQVASAAAAELATHAGIRSARGHTVEDRGRVLVRVVATVEPDALLPAVVASADLTRQHLEGAVGPDLPVRIELRTASRRRRDAVRVR